MTIASPDESISSGKDDAPGDGQHPERGSSASASESSVKPREYRRRSQAEIVLLNVLVPFVLLGLGGAVIVMLGKIEPPQKPDADKSIAGRLEALPAVRVLPVTSLEKSGADLYLHVDGTVVPFREVRVATEVAGKITFKAPECETGKYVTKGTLLIQIDSTDYELEVERLTRMAEQEYESLNETDQQIRNTKRLIEVAKREAELQQREVARLASLPANFASQGELDRAKRSVLQAETSVINQENQLDLLNRTRSRREAAERLAQTQLKVAQVNLKRTKILAPIDGVIVAEDAEQNTFVARGAVVVTMEDTSKVEVATSLRMDQLFWVLDQSERTTVDLNGDLPSSGYDLPPTEAVIEYDVAGRDGTVWRWNGRLLGYDGIGLDSRTRTVPVKVVVDSPRRYVDASGNQQTTNGPTALVRGMYVGVKLKLKPKTPLVVIPSRCLKPGDRIWQFRPDAKLIETRIAEEKAEAAKLAAEKAAEAAKSNDKDSGSDDQVAAVTEPPTVNTGDDAASTKAASKAITEVAAVKVPFNVDEWMPGTVQVVDEVIAVDSLMVDESMLVSVDKDGNLVNLVPEGDDAELDDQRRYWICEVRGGDVPDGSFVVSSPLGAVNNTSVDARAKRSGLSVTLRIRDQSDVTEKN